MPALEAMTLLTPFKTLSYITKATLSTVGYIRIMYHVNDLRSSGHATAMCSAYSLVSRRGKCLSFCLDVIRELDGGILVFCVRCNFYYLRWNQKQMREVGDTGI